MSASQPDTDEQCGFIRRHERDFMLSTELALSVTIISLKLYNYKGLH